jgi:CRISPR-associated protein Csx3
MSTYTIEVVKVDDLFADVKVGFGSPANNDQIVVDATAAAKAVVSDICGHVVRINGPASLPVAVALSHVWVHVTKAIAVFDPKLGQYVVAVSHDPAFVVGQLIAG